MGTDWPKFIAEAGRCLVPGGLLLISEVSSRFPDTKSFARSVEQLGFSLQSEDGSSNYFVIFHFRKRKVGSDISADRQSLPASGKKQKKKRKAAVVDAASDTGAMLDSRPGSASEGKQLSKKARRKAHHAAAQVDAGLLQACTYKRR